MVKCEFCLMLKKKIKKKEFPFNKKPDVALQSSLKEYNRIMENATYFGRGKSLCKKHMLTIKKDNKYRLSIGEDIPTTLKILRYQNDDY